MKHLESFWPHVSAITCHPSVCKILRMAFVRLMLVLVTGCAVITAQGIQPAELWKQSVAQADGKFAYGKDAALQFGELRLPKAKGPYPVVILVHGGCFVDRLPSARHVI